MGLVALLLGVAALAVAAIPSSSDDVIHGCYKNSGGALRVIDVEATPPETCTRSEVPISWNQQGPPGVPSPSVMQTKTHIVQTEDIQSGAGIENATSMPITGGADIPVAVGEWFFYYPTGVGVKPPASCNAAVGELHIDLIAVDVPGFGDFTLHSWVMSYNPSNTGPQLMPLDDFRFKNPLGAPSTAQFAVKAWDTCGADERWGIGSGTFGDAIKLHVDVFGIV